jgi:MPBQ/MSBQ methyltransferase
MELGPKRETSEGLGQNPLVFLLRLILGSLAGFYFFLLPIYMWIKNLIWPKDAKNF